MSVPDTLPGTLVMHRPDVLSAQRSLQASIARVGAAAANRLPTITLGGQYGGQQPDFNNLFAKSGEVYQLQAGISIPLTSGVRLANEQRAAEARSEQARAQYDQTVLTALRESHDAMAGVRLNRDQLAAQSVQVQALARAFDLAQERYENGVSSYLDAQRRLFTARLSLVQVERQYLVSAVDLYKALGGGWNAATR
jgi:outer membrane protein TolC